MSSNERKVPSNLSINYGATDMIETNEVSSSLDINAYDLKRERESIAFR